MCSPEQRVNPIRKPVAAEFVSVVFDSAIGQIARPSISGLEDEIFFRCFEFVSGGVLVERYNFELSTLSLAGVRCERSEQIAKAGFIEVRCRWIRLVTVEIATRIGHGCFGESDIGI